MIPLMSPHTSPRPEAPTAVVDYPARDMTITVGAGMTFGELSRILTQENQQLPIDVADDALVLGQIVADDMCGPRQFGYGTLRDYVIGIEAVDRRGRVFHAGGRVVKNVAGYDLCRLLIGSRGKLGTITQLTFKLKPIPVLQTLLVAGFRSSKDLESALNRLNISATCPVILDVVGRSVHAALMQDAVPELVCTLPCADAAALLVVGYEGPKAACEWQANTFREELAGTASWVHQAANPQATTLYCRRAQSLSRPSPDKAWLVRFITLPSRVVANLTSLQEAGCLVFGRALNGILFVSPAAVSAEGGRSDSEPESMTLLQSLVSDGVGSLDVLQSASARSTQSSAAVRRISQQLHELLGSSE